MLGDGPEQFRIRTWLDDHLLREQKIHDPFIHNTTVIGLSLRDVFRLLFSRRREIRVRVHVTGSEGAMRSIMMLDANALEAESQKILSERKAHRESADASMVNCALEAG